MPSAHLLARLLLVGLAVSVRCQPVPEQPPVVREFLQIRNHAIQLTSERLVSCIFICEALLGSLGSELVCLSTAMLEIIRLIWLLDLSAAQWGVQSLKVSSGSYLFHYLNPEKIGQTGMQHT